MNILRLFSLFILCMASMNAEAQPLDSLLKLAVDNNPELKALELEFQAEAMKADQVSQLTDPQIGVGLPILNPETRLGPQVLMVNASQMFPWFGTLKSKRDVALGISEVKYERIEIERLSLFNKIRIAYYKLQFLTKKEEILKAVSKQLEAMKNVSLSMVEAGMSSSTNALRVQLKIDELDQKIVKIKQEKAKEYAIINGLIKHPWDSQIIPDITEDFPVLSFNLEEIESSVKNNHPMLKMLEIQKEVSINRQELNQKMGAPKIGIGVDYAMVNERMDANPQNNGRDILTPKLMLTIPIYRKAFRAKEQEESLIQESLNYSHDQVVADLITFVLQFKADYENALLDFNFSANQIETTQLVYNMLLADYSSKGKGFDELLQVQMQLYNYQLDQEQCRLIARIAESNIQKITEFKN